MGSGAAASRTRVFIRPPHPGRPPCRLSVGPHLIPFHWVPPNPDLACEVSFPPTLAAQQWSESMMTTREALPPAPTLSRPRPPPPINLGSRTRATSKDVSSASCPIVQLHSTVHGSPPPSSFRVAIYRFLSPESEHMHVRTISISRPRPRCYSTLLIVCGRIKATPNHHRCLDDDWEQLGEMHHQRGFDRRRDPQTPTLPLKYD